MQVIIDETRCAGCGLCEENLPELFFLGDYYAKVKKVSLTEPLIKEIREIIEDCPAEAVKLIE